jgi:hypothetical protein
MKDENKIKAVLAEFKSAREQKEHELINIFSGLI